MLEYGKDMKGLDYIDRLQRLISSFLLNVISQGNQPNALNQTYLKILHLKWDYQFKTQSHSKPETSQLIIKKKLDVIFNEVYTIGAHASKAGLLSEMADVYQLLFDITLRDEHDSSNNDDNPLVYPLLYNLTFNCIPLYIYLHIISITILVVIYLSSVCNNVFTFSFTFPLSLNSGSVSIVL